MRLIVAINAYNYKWQLETIAQMANKVSAILFGMDSVQHTVSFQGQSIVVSLSGDLLQRWNIRPGGAGLDTVIKVGQSIIANHDNDKGPLEHTYSFDSGNAQPSLDHMLDWIRGERL